jgi:flavin-binding protein dodecin
MKKDKARQKAIELHSKTFEQMNVSWFEVIQLQNRIEKIGKQYGLLREFKNNGII